MKNVKRLYRFLFALFFIFYFTGCFSVNIKAEEQVHQQAEQIDIPVQYIEDFYIKGFFEDTSLGEWEIRREEINGQNYLFLPSAADLTKVKLCFDGDIPEGYILLNGEKFYSGHTLVLSEGENNLQLTVENSSQSFSVSVVKSKHIPSMFIKTESGSLDYIHQSKENKEKADMLLVREDGTIDYNSTLKHIKGRGNFTWGLSKKPYNIKLDSSADLLDMGKAKGWCLLANFCDHSLLRNQIVYDLADEVGIPFTMACKSIDLYINSHYMGTYLITEKVEIDKNRVNIFDLEKATEKANVQDLDTYTTAGTNRWVRNSKKWVDIPNDPSDITGGYLLELELNDRYADEVSGFVTSIGQAVVLKSPEYASKAQIDYISKFYQEMEDAIYSKDGYNSLGKHYTEYIDEESLARMYLLQEYSLNVDSGITSFYFYKDSDLVGDGKLHAAPVWDFDIAFGNHEPRIDAYYNYIDFTNPEVWWARNASIYNIGGLNIMAQALQHKAVYKKVVELWNEEFVPALKVLIGEETTYKPKVLRSLDDYVEEIAFSEKMNSLLWVGWYEYFPQGADTGRSFDANISFIRDFILRRRNFMDAEFAYENSIYEKLVGDVRIDGILRTGETLTAQIENSNYSGSFTYQWMADGIVIDGADEAAYVLTEAEEGKIISVRVTANQDKMIGYLEKIAADKVEGKDPEKPDPEKPDPEKPDPEKPDVEAPVKLSAPAVIKVISQKKGVKITYKKSENAAFYSVYRKTGNTFKKLGDTSKLSFIDKMPVGGKKTVYVVKAVSKDKEKFVDSGFGLGKAITLPKELSHWRGKQVKGKKAVILTWKKVKNASAYLIYRSDKKDGTYKYIGKSKGASAVRYTDRKNLKKKKYYYKISVLKNGKYSPLSKAVMVKMSKSKK